MSEITFETGEIPVCVDCQMKHAVDLKAHVDPERKEKYKLVVEIVDMIAEDLTMTKEQLADYEKIRSYEHKLEDYLTVLRGMRHKIEEETFPEEFEESNSGSNPKPRMGQLVKKCSFDAEVKLPKEHFDPKSLRTLCPECL